MKRQLGALAALAFSLALAAPMHAAADQTLLLRTPDISKDHLAFVYAGDIWVSARDGSDPRRLTSHPADESLPRFSPDGRWIAFTANYNNNTDVYVISSSGGQPTRLTYHPSDDHVTGWTSKGDRVTFSSDREVASGRSNQLYHISVAGGYPSKVMEAPVMEADYSPDGKRLAYRPYSQAYRGSSGWRQHRGGSTPPVWIYDFDAKSHVEIPHVNASDTNPIWLGDNVYFLSDRADGAVNLFGYETKSRKLTQFTKNDVWDIRSANGFGDTIVYEAGGHLYELKVKTGKAREIKISIAPDLPQLRPQWKNAASMLEEASLSPTGKRALVTARGDVFTVPTDEGSTRNITATDGVRERTAIWSPNGASIAYISDEGGTHRIMVEDQTGMSAANSFELEDAAYYSLLFWGGDGSQLIYQDNHLNLYALDIRSGKSLKVATNNRRGSFAVAQSSDGRWLAFTIAGANYFDRVMLYGFDNGKTFAVTDGLSHASYPAFSPDGKYLYFVASTNSGPSQVGLDMSTQERPLRFGLYAAILQADGKSPLLPKAGDEEVKKGDAKSDEKRDDTEKKEEEEPSGKPEPVRIDTDGLPSRIIALPVPERAYDTLKVASDGGLFFMERQQPGVSHELPDSDRSAVDTLMRFDFEEKTANSAFERVSGFDLSADGKKLIVMGAGSHLMVADASANPHGKGVSLGDVKTFVDPRHEWGQIFDEAWRMERDYFYAPNMHGLDWDAVYKRYRTLVDHVGRREDLNTLMVEMIGELQVGHNRVRGGDVHRETGVSVGLLGADLRVEDSRYRVEKIYTGERWNPFLKAPLAIPGIGVEEGDFILAVNGQEVTADSNIFAYFEDTVGKQVTLRVAGDAKGKDVRDVVVEPIGREDDLRHWHWVESNRKKVAEATDGRVAYVYLPNTAGAGFTYFNRMFFAQVDKKAIVIDERSNGGGQAANYITDVLSRTYLASWKDRDGMTFDTPGGAIYGPKVMLIDQDAGSGGDFLPYAFKRMKLGTLIGARTWGGLIGISANPDFIDGGQLVVPFFRFYTPDGEWRVENEGVSPDINVVQEPGAINEGRDPQLERAIAQILKDLDEYRPIKRHEAPPIPTEVGK
ncbi:S41 family peptidase [Kordiimonas aestuarii]|uniref:S41 family peptidase n=1 Tax=Kordiimonas aestuarii TaxID=1005925 RepID=UPI0021CE764F|nr:S41 family peptidase [Kordiimonas aestuarii]